LNLILTICVLSILLIAQMKPIKLQEWRHTLSAPCTSWVVEERAAVQPLALPQPQVPTSLWRSAMLRRVKHPRLQFDKGVQVDVLA
jgi:hypothetical protein